LLFVICHRILQLDRGNQKAVNGDSLAAVESGEIPHWMKWHKYLSVPMHANDPPPPCSKTRQSPPAPGTQNSPVQFASVHRWQSHRLGQNVSSLIYHYCPSALILLPFLMRSRSLYQFVHKYRDTQSPPPEHDDVAPESSLIWRGTGVWNANELKLPPCTPPSLRRPRDFMEVAIRAVIACA